MCDKHTILFHQRLLILIRVDAVRHDAREDITGVPPYKRPVNTVFQKYALFPHLHVFENVAFCLRLKKMDEETIRRTVRDMLEVVGLKGFERRSISQMSGEMCIRDR